MEFCPASSSPSAAAVGPLSWTFVPFSTFRIWRLLCVRRASHRSSRVRLQGLITLWTVLSRQTRTGSVSYRQRSWDSPFGAFPSRTVLERFRSSGPTCRLFVRFTTPHEVAGPARTTAASGLCPVRESLATGALLARRPPAAPLDFSLSRPAGCELCRASPASSRTLFAIQRSRTALRHRVSRFAAWSEPEPYARHGWIRQPS
jgi:hypothetical protein